MSGHNLSRIKHFITHFDEQTKSVKVNKNASWPRLTVVTPSYNQVNFLERTILSVLNQNYPNLEYIIIDGGSTDGTVEIIKKYESSIDYWISEPDNGQAEAINKGFSKATGQIVAWQNSDDIYLPGALEKIGHLFSKRPDTDIVFGDNIIIDENDLILDEQRFVPFSVNTHLYDTLALSNQSAFWKRELMSRIGMLDPQFHFSMDYEFFLRAGIKGAKFYHIPKFLGAFRIHNRSKTKTIPHFAVDDHKKIYSIYGINNGHNFYKKLISQLKRSFYYLTHGGISYILRGLIKRGSKLVG